MNCSWFHWGFGFNWYWLNFLTGFLIIAFVIYLLVRLLRSQNSLPINTMKKRSAAESCPACGAPIEPEYIRCPECHYKLKTTCPNCHRIVKTNWKICPFCETKLVEK